MHDAVEFQTKLAPGAINCVMVCPLVLHPSAPSTYLLVPCLTLPLFACASFHQRHGYREAMMVRGRRMPNMKQHQHQPAAAAGTYGVRPQATAALSLQVTTPSLFFRCKSFVDVKSCRQV